MTLKIILLLTLTHFCPLPPLSSHFQPRFTYLQILNADCGKRHKKVCRSGQINVIAISECHCSKGECVWFRLSVNIWEKYQNISDCVGVLYYNLEILLCRTRFCVCPGLPFENNLSLVHLSSSQWLPIEDLIKLIIQ